MSQKLEGKIALVTGGSRGIGAAIAKRLAADGANVAITYTKGADAAASVVKAIERAGRKAIAIQADATDAGAVEAAVEKTVATFGRLDVLVNNAGTAIPKRFEETTLEELDRLIDINVRGIFIATQAALKQMKSGGRIIMIGSCVGERAMTPGLVPYSATKGAVKMFTQGLSREVGSRGITVNNIQPGPINRSLKDRVDTKAFCVRKRGSRRRHFPHMRGVEFGIAKAKGRRVSLDGRAPVSGSLQPSFPRRRRPSVSKGARQKGICCPSYVYPLRGKSKRRGGGLLRGRPASPR
jgi:3-oxoacyl-[acyl-carrier protein] reductase